MRGFSGASDRAAHVHHSRALMEVTIDAAGERTADAFDILEIGNAGAAYPLGRAKGPEQRLLALRPDAGHLVERIGRNALEAAGAMGADGKAMGLIAQALDEIKHRLARLEHEGGPAGQMEMFPPGVAIGTLGHGYHRQVAKTQLLQDGQGGAELPGAAIDHRQIRPDRRPGGGALAFVLLGKRIARAMLLEEPREAAAEDLAHHREIIAGGEVLGTDVELAVAVLHEAFRPGDDHRADRIGSLDVRVVEHLDAARRGR